MLSIIIVTYNSIRYLPDFMDSLLGQTYFKSPLSSKEIFVVDNASHDNTVKFIKNHYPHVHLMRNVRNVGLARAWNQAIQITRGEYILIMNPDLILDKNYLEILLKAMQGDQTVASAGGKLYQLKSSSINQGELSILEKTNVLDSCGLVGFKNRRFVDRGSGEIDKGQYNQQQDVFGISGACVLYRRRALEQIKFNQEYFDEDFFIYQEDIDLAWRLRLAGWSSLYVPRAIAYHHRRARSLSQKNFLKIIKYRRQKQDFINFYSYRNHCLMLYKNLLFKNFIHHGIYILFYELKKFLYVLILENSTLRHSIMSWLKLFKKIYYKRRLNLRLQRLKADDIRQWFE